MSSSDCDRFFAENLKPSNFDSAKQEISAFCNKHRERGIVLVTSGGTTVPLELKTVRYVDNFSLGTRGATSAEYFLRNGWAVIFLHRDNSLQPFARFLSGSNMLEWLDVSGDDVLVNQQKAKFVKSILQEYKSYTDRLCRIQFTSLADYLWLLRISSQILNDHPRAILYLAAAVSDFYVPSEKLPQHKLQSSQGVPAINLHIVPKMLAPLVNNWAPNSFIISFKLETDPNLLISKAEQALEKYGHNVVVGNILETRKREVWIVTANEQTKIEMEAEALKSGCEIEERLITALLERASAFWNKS